MIVAGEVHNLELAEWLADRSPHFEVNATPYVALGWRRRGELVAVVVFDNFTRINIDAHIAAEPGGLNGRFLCECFRYAFEQLNVKRLTARVPATNTASRAFCESSGFKFEGLMRQALAGDEDLVIFGMLRGECQWAGVGKHGSKYRRALGAAVDSGAAGDARSARRPDAGAAAADRLGVRGAGAGDGATDAAI